MHPDKDDEKSEGSTTLGILQSRAFDAPRFEAAIGELLAACGVDDDGHTKKTAVRVRKLWQERLLGGYESDVAETLGAGFEDDGTDLVVIKGISVHGLCPHHLVPFHGVAHVAYHPGGRLHGFGRIARLVDVVANRFTYQEWITRNIADALVKHGKAQGAAVVVEAKQLCLLLGENRRGEERVHTSAFAGTLKENQKLRDEFFTAIR
ncbi:MAG: GTP cyclohydrolase I FolE [Deltaproteobacteria bacterium]|nr:GTP cyclohydrolase I FolE [Deltaproteobacteria bacterium]